MYVPYVNLMLFHLLFLHILVFGCQASRFTDETDKQALLEFQSNLSENSRVALPSWNDSFALCKWTGVTCGQKHKRVTGLNLVGMKLVGVISPSICNLSFLTSLSLAENSFHGSIPYEVGKLFRLQHLNLSNNVLGGRVPLGISNCSALLTNDLSANNLEHEIPSELGSLSSLALLSLRGNNLTGKFPASLGNLTSLQKLDVEYNRMEGEIPDSMSRLTKMKFLRIAANNFSGVFPHAICNLSSLLFLSIPDNSFFGKLRLDLDLLFPDIQVLFLGGNDFEGEIPSSLANITSLQKFDLAECHMTGSIPSSIERLHNLEILGLGYNSLGSYSSRDLDFLSSLNNCTQLQYLGAGYNRLGGNLPPSIANLSNQLTYLSLGGNLISGSIPLDIGNLESLQSFTIEQNLLTGEVPASLGKLSRLERLLLQSNRISGDIPSSLGNLSMVARLYLYNNSFKGSIPSSLRNCSYLLYLSLGSNRLCGAIPQELMEVRSLVNLDISNNSLTGHFPSEVGKLANLLQLDVSHNQLSGIIPQTLGSCLSMEELTLNGNFFEGTIIDISRLRNLKLLDLSNNNLSGPIPEYLGNLSSIQYLNLSVNNLEGPVPTEGTFRNSSKVSIFGNINLCGGIPELQLKPCSVQGEQKSRKHSSTRKKITIGIGAGVTSVFVSIIAIIFLCWIKNHRVGDTNIMDISAIAPLHERVRYKELHNATGGFSLGNMIGSGNFGIVYKAFLGLENRAVAIKVLNLKKRGAAKSFIAECEALKGVRHRNLLKLVTACSSMDYKGNEFRALVYEFMPNGSLDMWLHQEEIEGSSDTSRPLTLLERFNIAIDVASVLDYLHVNCHDPIAHCDIKPSNVLLDDDLTAHVSDFGLARLLYKFDRESFINQLSSAGVRGTIGYAAPEYGMGGQPSIHGDVYSFGVLLLEMFTGKRPTDELFGGNLTLHSYTKSALPERVLDIADKLIFQSGLRVGFPIAECLTLVLEVGLKCCEELPTNRLATSEVVKELFSIKERFLKARRTARR